nr:MAG TPA: Transcriptional regulator, RHH-like, CopG [Caudoviricetes sp.]
MNELAFYENIVKHCESNNLSLQGYIKDLVRKDLNNDKGIK